MSRLAAIALPLIAVACVLALWLDPRGGNSDVAGSKQGPAPSLEEDLKKRVVSERGFEPEPLAIPTPLAPAAGAALVLAENEETEISWAPSPLATSYEVVLTPKESPERALTFRSSTSSLKIKNPGDGIYSWSVRALDENGRKSELAPAIVVSLMTKRVPPPSMPVTRKSPQGPPERPRLETATSTRNAQPSAKRVVSRPSQPASKAAPPTKAANASRPPGELPGAAGQVRRRPAAKPVLLAPRTVQEKKKKSDD